MNWKNLEKTVAMAQQKLQEVELRALNAERAAKAAKAKAQQLKLEHRRAKKTAQEAKRVAANVAEEAREQCRSLEKAERRLAKALKKAGRVKPSAPKAPVAASARRLAVAKAGATRMPAGKGTTVSLATRRSAGNGHRPLASPHSPGDVSPS